MEKKILVAAGEPLSGARRSAYARIRMCLEAARKMRDRIR